MPDNNLNRLHHCVFLECRKESMDRRLRSSSAIWPLPRVVFIELRCNQLTWMRLVIVMVKAIRFVFFAEKNHQQILSFLRNSSVRITNSVYKIIFFSNGYNVFRKQIVVIATNKFLWLLQQDHFPVSL